MRLLAFIEYTMVVAGIAGILSARVYHLPLGFTLGLGLVGAGIALGGLESMHLRRMSFRFSSFREDDYAGTPAVIWGATIFVIGAVLIAAAYLMNEGAWGATVLHLSRRPGALLALAGLVIAGAGALVMVSPRSRGLAWTLLVRVPKTLIGAALVAAGAIAVALGIWETLDPRSFTRIVDGALAEFGLGTFGHYWRMVIRRLL